jgi:hypothetical protein
MVVLRLVIMPIDPIRIILIVKVERVLLVERSAELM